MVFDDEVISGLKIHTSNAYKQNRGYSLILEPQHSMAQGEWQLYG
jgi:hypothetical protein